LEFPVSTPCSVSLDLALPSMGYTGTLIPPTVAAERGTFEGVEDTVLEGAIGSFDFGGGDTSICDTPILDAFG